jgi:hypothetical protein
MSLPREDQFRNYWKYRVDSVLSWFHFFIDIASDLV